MKRTFLCILLTLSLLLTAGCGNGATSSSAASSGATSSGTASSGASSSGASSSSAASSAADDNAVPEFQAMDYSIGLLDNGFFEGVTALDHVTLPELEGIVISKDVQTVADEDLQTAIDTILAEYASDGRIYDRPVADGDQVNIDYVGSIDGVEFQGGNTQGQGTLVMAGGTNYIDDFLTQIIGAKPGDTVKVEVTFPTPYENNPELSGKDAVFETVINYIQGESVVPELTEELIAEHIKDDYGYTSVEDMKQSIAKTLREDQMRTCVLEWLLANCNYGEVPETIIEDQKESLRMELSNTANDYSMPLSTLLGYYGWDSLEAAYATYMENFIAYGQQYLACQAVMEKLGVEIGEKERDHYFNDVLGLDNYESAAAYFGLGYISQDTMVNYVADYLVENAIIE